MNAHNVYVHIFQKFTQKRKVEANCASRAHKGKKRGGVVQTPLWTQTHCKQKGSFIDFLTESTEREDGKKMA